MKIKIQREGGFIGITSKANLDYNDLTAAEQKALDSLADQSLKADSKPKQKDSTQKAEQPLNSSRDLNADASAADGLEIAGHAPPHNTQSNMMRDAFSYSISMKKDGKTVSLKFDDMNAPPEIVQIFQKYVQY